MPTVTATPALQQQAGTSRFIKVPDVAELLGIPASTVYELARQKRIGGLIRFGRHIRFDREALERWLQEGGEREAA